MEVYQPFESLLATCDGLKGGTAMLTNQSAAREAFKQFDDVSARITR